MNNRGMTEKMNTVLPGVCLEMLRLIQLIFNSLSMSGGLL